MMRMLTDLMYVQAVQEIAAGHPDMEVMCTHMHLNAAHFKVRHIDGLLTASASQAQQPGLTGILHDIKALLGLMDAFCM